MANKALVIAACAVALAGVGLVAFDDKLEGTRPVLDGATLAAELDVRLRDATTAVSARTETLAALPSLHDSVSTDAKTVRGQTQRELSFQPKPGESITIAQVPVHGEPTTLLALPEGATAADVAHDGVRLGLERGQLVVTDVVSVTPSEAARAAELRGALAITQPVDLEPLRERLVAMAASMTLRLDGKTARLGAERAGARDVLVPVVPASPLAARLEVEASVPTVASGPPFRFIGGGGIALSVVLLGLGLGRARPRPRPRPRSHHVEVDVGRAATLAGNVLRIGEGSVIADTYEVVRLLGRGGMGTVWEATHLRLPDRRVAIKLLTIEDQTQEHLARFRREAEVTSRLGHPNIVGVLDFNTLPSGQPYIVLEYLEGESLADRLDRAGPIGLDEALAYATQIASALSAAHAAGVVHRDLKPDNIFLVPSPAGLPIVKVLDFGISKMRGSVTVQTKEAQILGTPQYMSPEQANGKNSEVDARTDVWALGTIVFEMLVGQPAFAGETMTSLLVNVLVNPSPSLRGTPGVPDRVARALDLALEKDAALRWRDMPSFIEALTT